MLFSSGLFFWFFIVVYLIRWSGVLSTGLRIQFLLSLTGFLHLLRAEIAAMQDVWRTDCLLRIKSALGSGHLKSELVYRHIRTGLGSGAGLGYSRRCRGPRGLCANFYRKRPDPSSRSSPQGHQAGRRICFQEGSRPDHRRRRAGS